MATLQSLPSNSMQAPPTLDPKHGVSNLLKFVTTPRRKRDPGPISALSKGFVETVVWCVAYRALRVVKGFAVFA